MSRVLIDTSQGEVEERINIVTQEHNPIKRKQPICLGKFPILTRMKVIKGNTDYFEIKIDDETGEILFEALKEIRNTLITIDFIYAKPILTKKK